MEQTVQKSRGLFTTQTCHIEGRGAQRTGKVEGRHKVQGMQGKAKAHKGKAKVCGGRLKKRERKENCKMCKM